MSIRSERRASGTAEEIPDLAHVALVVGDLSRARAFYGSVLGLPEVPRPTDVGPPGAWFQAGRAQIHLLVAEIDGAPAAAPVVRSHVALSVPSAGLTSLIERVRAAGETVVRERSSRTHFGRVVSSAFCADADGNLIELTDMED
jgi:glyoxylase I family protein